MAGRCSLPRRGTTCWASKVNFSQSLPLCMFIAGPRVRPMMKCEYIIGIWFRWAAALWYDLVEMPPKRRVPRIAARCSQLAPQLLRDKD